MNHTALHAHHLTYVTTVGSWPRHNRNKYKWMLPACDVSIIASLERHIATVQSFSLHSQSPRSKQHVPVQVPRHRL